ncbi:hypothetical protein [Aquabacterium sp.]
MNNAPQQQLVSFVDPACVKAIGSAAVTILGMKVRHGHLQDQS